MLRRRLSLHAIITAGRSFRTGKYTMAARVQVKGGTSVAFSRDALRELAELGVMERLRRDGFRWREEPLAHFPLGAWKSVYPSTFSSERSFLSELTGTNAGTSMREDLDGFRGVLRERCVLETTHLGDPD